MATKAIARRRTYVSRPRAHRAAKMTVPVAVVAGFLPLTMRALAGWKEGGIEGASHQLIMGTTGYDHREKKWRFPAMAQGLGPMLAGIVVHKLAGRLGVNRAIARAGVPFLRI